MKLIVGMLLITFLYGCGVSSGGETKKDKEVQQQVTSVVIEQWTVLGDSNCDRDYLGYSWPDMLGIPSNCKGGRALGFFYRTWDQVFEDYYDIPKRLILALGDNNFGGDHAPGWFYETYKWYIEQADEVICVLPSSGRWEAEIRSLCSVVVEGIKGTGGPDGRHFTYEQSLEMAERVAEVL